MLDSEAHTFVALIGPRIRHWQWSNRLKACCPELLCVHGSLMKAVMCISKSGCLTLFAFRWMNGSSLLNVDMLTISFIVLLVFFFGMHLQPKSFPALKIHLPNKSLHSDLQHT